MNRDIWWLRQQRICLQRGRPGFEPWFRKIPCRRKWQPTPGFLPAESHGQRSLAGYSPWGCKESDMTERLTLFFFFFNCVYWLHCTLFTYFTILVSGIQQHKSVIITNNYTYMASLLSLPPFLPHPTRLGHQRAPPGLPVLHCGFPKASVLTHGSVYTSVLLSQLTPRSQLTPPSPEQVTSLVAQTVKRLPTVRQTWVRSLDQEDPLEKEMATHSSTLAWEIPWTEEHGRLQSMGSQSVGHD